MKKRNTYWEIELLVIKSELEEFEKEIKELERLLKSINRKLLVKVENEQVSESVLSQTSFEL